MRTIKVKRRDNDVELSRARSVHVAMLDVIETERDDDCGDVRLRAYRVMNVTEVWKSPEPRPISDLNRGVMIG